MANEVFAQMKKRAFESLSSGEVKQVLAWKNGDFPTLPEPSFFTGINDLEELIYDKYCTANLSKYLTNQKDTKTLVFLRKCDSESFLTLVSEKQINRDNVYVIGVPCKGLAYVHEGDDLGFLEGCLSCTRKEHAVFDELIQAPSKEKPEPNDRFAEVVKLEKLPEEERYNFWKNELSKCIRCNACRNVCPICHCNKCVFNNETYDSANKVNTTTFDEQMFHLTRAYHVAGRCTDCFQCSRVCPQNIPLHLLNRKFIKDIQELYGEEEAALTSFNINNDPEPRNGGI